MKTTLNEIVMSVPEPRPPAGLRVIVVCKKSRCLGYVDREGVWRDNARHAELHDVTGWIEI